MFVRMRVDRKIWMLPMKKKRLYFIGNFKKKAKIGQMIAFGAMVKVSFTGLSIFIRATEIMDRCILIMCTEIKVSIKYIEVKTTVNEVNVGVTEVRVNEAIRYHY